MTQETESLREGKLLYQQLRSQLRRDIVAGVYPVHSRIPSEMELCRRYQVSRVTVRRALGALVNDGLLERYQGKGTFVSVPRLSKSLRDVNSFSSACLAMGCEPQTKLIAAHLIPGDELLSAALSCSPEEHLVEMIRLRLADDKPVMLEINHFPAAYAWLIQERLDGSLYDLLKTRGVEPGQASHEISLCYADERDAKWLDVEKGSALLYLNEIIYDADGQPLHTSRQHIRGDRFTFRI